MWTESNSSTDVEVEVRNQIQNKMIRSRDTIHEQEERQMENDNSFQNFEDSVGPKILIVDDDCGVRRMAAKLLATLGYVVFEAKHGSEALQFIDSTAKNIDLVITDVYMPGLRGSELAERLHEKKPGLPVLFMSGYEERDMVRCGIPMDSRFLQKPFGTSELKRTVYSALNPSAVAPGHHSPSLKQVA